MEALRPARSNSIRVLLGNSKWGYLDVFANRTQQGDQSGDATRAFIVLLLARLADGTTLRFATASNDTAQAWHCTRGPVIYDHLYHGEIYDARAVAMQPAVPAVAMHPAAGDGTACMILLNDLAKIVLARKT